MGNISKGIISNLNESYINKLLEAENNFIIALSKESVQVIANNIEDDLYEAYIKEVFTDKADLVDENKIGYSTTINKDEAQKFSKAQAQEYAADIKEQGGWNTVAAVLSENEKLNEGTTDISEAEEEYKEAYGMDLDSKKVPCVIARDKFLSGWGQAEGVNHYQVVLCGDSTEAANIESTMKNEAKSEGLSNIRRTFGIPKLKSMSYCVGRYAKAWNTLSDSWYEDRFNTSNTENEEATESENIEEGVISNFKQKHLADRIGKTHAKMMTDKNPSEKDIEKTRKQYDKDWKEIHNLAKKEQEKELAKTRKNNEKANKYSKKADEHIKKANFASTKVDNLIRQATDKYLDKTNESEELNESFDSYDELRSEVEKAGSLYDLVSNNASTMDIELLREIALGALYYAQGHEEEILNDIKDRHFETFGESEKLKEDINYDDSSWIVEQVENAMNPVFNSIDDRFNTEMGYDESFCTNLCEYIEGRLEYWLENNKDEDLEESEKLKEEYSEKLGGDPNDFINDVEIIKQTLSDIDTSKLATHLAQQMVEDFYDKCITQIDMAKARFLGESEELNEDDRIMKDQNIEDIMNSYSSRNNHLKYKIDGNTAIYEDGTEITFYKNDESEIEYTITKDGKTSKPELVQTGLTESEKLKEDSYDSGIFKEIENALIEYGFDVDRYIDAGVLTRNIGWEVSKDGQSTQLDCPGSWYDEDLDESEKLKEDEKYYDLNIKYTDGSNGYARMSAEGAGKMFTGEIYHIDTIKVNGNTTLKEDESIIHKMKDCGDDVEVITALEGDTLELDDMEDWNRLKALASSLANSQGFYGRLLRDMEEAEENLDETSFPIYL